MAAIKLVSKTREEWLENRKGGIGASEVASVLGINPWQTPYQLWLLKTGRIPPTEENMAMRLGHLLEDSVATLWSEETNREVIKATATDFMYVDKKKPFLRVSPDREFWLPGEKKNKKNRGILECKTTQKNIDEDNIPQHWFCQVQMNLGVSGYEHASLAWLSSGRNFGFKDIEFNGDFYGFMVEELERFWVDNVLADKEPESISAEDVLLKYPISSDAKTTEVEEEIALACGEYKKLKDEIAALEEKQKEIENKVKMAFGDSEMLTFGGLPIATWKSSKPSERFDTAAFKKANPEEAAKYIKLTQGSRRFIVK